MVVAGRDLVPGAPCYRAAWEAGLAGVHRAPFAPVCHCVAPTMPSLGCLLLVHKRQGAQIVVALAGHRHFLRPSPGTAIDAGASVPWHF